METPIAYNGVAHLSRPLMLDADVKPPAYLPKERSTCSRPQATVLPFKPRVVRRRSAISAPRS